MSRTLLRIELVVATVLFFLITPFSGLEPRARPFAAHGFEQMLPTGFIIPPSVIVAIGLNIAALIFLSKRPRRAAALAMAGPFLAGIVLATDQLGFFSTLPAPQLINVLEFGLVVVEVAVVVAATREFRQSAA